jgi:hypothetical protein
MSGKDILGHLATRETSWPEYCLEAVDEMISAVQELSRTPPIARDSPSRVTGAQLILNHGPQGPRQAQDVASTPNKRQGTSNWNASTGGIAPGPSLEFSPSHAHVSTSVGIVDQVHNAESSSRDDDPLQSVSFQQRTPLRAGNGVGLNPSSANRSGLANANNHSGLALVPEVIDPSIDGGPVEGQESMMWYDQLFASSFSAIDNPFLVAAEFDASIDPTWNYLR